jgi:hypothetical protein
MSRIGLKKSAREKIVGARRQRSGLISIPKHREQLKL